MKVKELRALVCEMSEETQKIFSKIYTDPLAQRDRFLGAIDSFVTLFGEDREVSLLSVPGRSEVLGNHTDHNRGKVLAGAIDKDIIAVVSPNADGAVNLKSEGYEKDTVDLSLIGDKDAYPKYSSASLVLGTARGFKNAGYKFGGFDAYATSDVLRGSGISSSAAFEVMIGNAFSHLYNGGKIANAELAKIAQYAENEFFGKPCGLMDQMACAVGGFVYIDFEDAKNPVIESIEFSLGDAGYNLCIVNTGGNHADLNEDYASVPGEMKSVAKIFDREVLRGLTEADIISKIAEIREKVGDRALLRAVHFIRENGRVEDAKAALLSGDVDGFFGIVKASGKSSFEFLQNVYTNKNVKEQGLSLALLVTEGFLNGKNGACRVHGGGFAGTIQAYIKKEEAEDYSLLMQSIFGEGAVMKLNVRLFGAVKII